MLWSLATFLGEGNLSRLWAGSSFSVPLPWQMPLFFLTALASALGPLAGRAPAVGRLWGKGLLTLMGLVVQSACLSVGQQVFIYLSGWREAYWMAGSHGLPVCSLSPSHYPTHNCPLINSQIPSWLVELLLKHIWRLTPYSLQESHALPSVLGVQHSGPSLSFCPYCSWPLGTACCHFNTPHNFSPWSCL